ncbi:MAG: TIGR02147 family protein [Fibrobacterales bacterium]
MGVSEKIVNDKGISIFDYWNYVDFLRDWFELERVKSAAFSHQYFANKAGFKSRSYMANVISGRRQLSVDSLLKMALAMRLSKRETHYLEALINYQSAEGDNQKQYYRDQLLYLKPAKEIYTLEKNYTEFLENWYVSVIRELIHLNQFHDDFKLIGQQIIPPVPAKKVKDAVNLLIKLGMVEKIMGSAGVVYKQINSCIETPPYLPRSLAIRNFQRRTIELAGGAIERFTKSERNIVGATFSTNEEGRNAMDKLIIEFQKKMVKIASEYENNADQVFQTNVQFFPVTKKQ